MQGRRSMLLDGVIPRASASLNSLPSGIEAGLRCGNQQAGDQAWKSDEAFLLLISRCTLGFLSKT